ncbi:ribosomal-protein-alanine N-acetyltransferase [Streptomyces sp. WMMB 714]|uniref:GNAT family N-acetyltransferase n=1 Tax=Streptomyces sp. WMMB 714 TaxID=1286822 RepID=UPI0005F88ABA|nr:GNAT family N-acetyltransferase [Streptomyces sp. WMMB 714]SCK58073.1 ribosomal-protein-alanine N-acetyltransferase [Streptomyces sp. WMMB 714]
MASADREFLLSGPRVGIRHVTCDDRAELSALARESAELHRPWVPQRDMSREAFSRYVARFDEPTHEGYMVCLRHDGSIVGGVNVNNIVRGSLQRGTLGYAAYAPTAGRGYMTEGLGLVIRYAFGELGLHRLEADIQPENTRSSKLVARLGFRLEGHSPAFQLIDGEWRDHDRWAITRQDRERTDGRRADRRAGGRADVGQGLSPRRLDAD